MFALGIPATLSQNPLLANVKIFGKNFFDLFDFISSNVLLPVGGLAIAIIGGWFLTRKGFAAEMNKGYAEEPWHGRLVYGIIKYVTPVLILLILLSSLGVLKLG
jgi:NSS family neurotransmitter:Na+ symporter